MNVTDTIADYLTRVRNGLKAGHKIVDIPASSMKKRITEILHDQGYILQYKFEDELGPQGTIRIALKYTSGKPVIRELTRVSKPGLRKYVNVDELPRVKNGLGIAILSTSKGVITNKEAKELKVGGEVLCYVS
jgi:small subunit ribosomal protein S8